MVDIEEDPILEEDKIIQQDTTQEYHSSSNYEEPPSVTTTIEEMITPTKTEELSHSVTSTSAKKQYEPK